MDQLADQIDQSLTIAPKTQPDTEREKTQQPTIVVDKGLKEFAKWIETGNVKNILVLCGAGVSVSAGTYPIQQQQQQAG